MKIEWGYGGGVKKTDLFEDFGGGDLPVQGEEMKTTTKYTFEKNLTQLHCQVDPILQHCGIVVPDRS